MALLVVVLLVGVIFLGAMAIGWVVLAQEVSPRVANAVLVMFVGFGLAVWVASQASFDAGY